MNKESFCDDEINYEKGKAYWSKVEPTVDGVLGGFGSISSVDIQESNKFLSKLPKLSSPPGNSRALDCGAGIGRISINVLVNHFNTVDLLEQNSIFLDHARNALKNEYPNKVGKFICSALQDFEPTENYDVIWCQWVLGHLTDVDLIKFFQKCIKHLNTNGAIIVKENVTSSNKDELDEVDSSKTRTKDKLCSIFLEVGLKIKKTELQKNFPTGLYKVYTFLLKL